jgi:hypothetical protein
MMYLDKRMMANGRYRYLIACPDCYKERWISDLRAKRCKECARKAKVLNFCRVWPCHCKYCNEPMIVKSKPKKEGVATCDKCKGIFGGRKAKPKEPIIKKKIKCSECNKEFEPKSRTAKTCSPECRDFRKRRLTKLKSRESRKITKRISKVKHDFISYKKEPKPKAKPKAKAEFKFKEHDNNFLSEDEKSRILIDKFFKEGGEPSVKFADYKEDVRSGITGLVRIDFNG